MECHLIYIPAYASRLWGSPLVYATVDQNLVCGNVREGFLRTNALIMGFLPLTDMASTGLCCADDSFILPRHLEASAELQIILLTLGCCINMCFVLILTWPTLGLP